MDKIPFQGERIRNVVLFFVERVSDIGNTKLYKLLYFLDQKAYVATGFTITGLDYHVLKRGPAPLEIVRDLQKDPDFKPSFFVASVVKRSRPHAERADEGETYLTAKRGQSFQSEYFSAFELELMHEVLEKYGKMSGAKLSQETHIEGKPWHDALENKGLNSLVDFDVDMELYTDTEKIEKRKYMQHVIRQFEARPNAL